MYLEEVEAARRLGPEGRSRQALQLMEENFQWARSLGEVEMRRRAAVARLLREHGCYGPPVPRLIHAAIPPVELSVG